MLVLKGNSVALPQIIILRQIFIDIGYNRIQAEGCKYLIEAKWPLL